MTKKAIIISFTLAFIAGVGAFLFYSVFRNATQPTPRDSEFNAQQPVLQAPQQGEASATPLPPPPTSTNNIAVTQEPPRKLVGTTQERLKQIEQSLPTGSQIYLSPIGDDKSVAALVDNDLYRDGVTETIVVHTSKTATAQEPTPRLLLSVLGPGKGALSIRASVQLQGGVLSNMQLNGSEVPLAVVDITGDGRPEIIVASGVGASLGAMLHVFKVEGTSLFNLSEIEGNVFRIQTRTSKPSVITVQSRYENNPKTYQWDGTRFTPVS